MQRRIRLLSVIVALLLIRSASLVQAQGETRYSDSVFHYSFQIPASYKKINPYMATGIVGFRGKDGGGIGFRNEALGGMKLDDFVQAAREQLKVLKELKWVGGEGKPTKLGGYPAYTWTWSNKGYDKKTTQNRQVFCVKDNRGYTLTYTTPVADSARLEKQFDRVIASFKWDKPKK